LSYFKVRLPFHKEAGLGVTFKKDSLEIEEVFIYSRGNKNT